MQPSSTKKRRLEALNQQQQQQKQQQQQQRASRRGAPPPAAAGSAQGGSQRQQASQQRRRQQQQPPLVAAGGSAGPTQAGPGPTTTNNTTTTTPGGVEHAAEGPPQFPYQPLDAIRAPPSAHIASRLQLPGSGSAAAAAGSGGGGSSGCRGNVEDALEQLMKPHMPLPVAQSMIAARTAADKAVVLVNPTGKINLARPSSSSKGQRQLLAAKLMPRHSRVQLSALPKAGIDYAALLSLHELWCKYVSGVLAARTPDNFERLLQTLDWHGALVRVASSSNPIYVHRAGIVAKATLNTFVLVSDDGRSSVVPLKGSSFEASVECGGRLLQLLLRGDSLKTLKCTEQQGV